jgi:hypothetical protein
MGGPENDMTARPRRFARPTILAAALGLTAALAAGCSGASTPTPEATPTPTGAPSVAPSPSPSPSPSPAPSASSTEPGVIGSTGTVSVPEIGLTITLADGWQAIPLTEDGLAAIVDAFPEGSQMAQILGQQGGALALAGVKLWALDTEAALRGDTTAGNLNIIAQPAPAGLDVSLLGQLARAQLEALDGTSGVAVEPVALAAGDAVRATYRLEETLADGTTVDVVGTQYYLVSDGRLLIVTFSGATEDADQLAATFEAMADSIALG